MLALAYLEHTDRKCRRPTLHDRTSHKHQLKTITKFPDRYFNPLSAVGNYTVHIQKQWKSRTKALKGLRREKNLSPEAASETIFEIICSFFPGEKIPIFYVRRTQINIFQEDMSVCRTDTVLKPFQPFKKYSWKIGIFSVHKRRTPGQNLEYNVSVVNALLFWTRLYFSSLIQKT